MRNDPHNTFRPTDAMEYVDAYRNGVALHPADIRQKLQQLNSRMDNLEDIPTYLLAAYRGYEDALQFVEHRIVPGVVKLDDTDPTTCEPLTPVGYVRNLPR